MNKFEMLKVLENVDCEEYKFDIIDKDGLCFLLARYEERDIQTGEVETQTTRKWYISEFATKSELIQTALKCVITSMEHRAREKFTYKGKRIFGPHFDIDALHNICSDSKNYDYRPPKVQDGVEWIIDHSC